MHSVPRQFIKIGTLTYNTALHVGRSSLQVQEPLQLHTPPLFCRTPRDGARRVGKILQRTQEGVLREELRAEDLCLYVIGYLSKVAETAPAPTEGWRPEGVASGALAVLAALERLERRVERRVPSATEYSAERRAEYH